LPGGRLSTEAAAIAAGAKLGQLTSTAVHGNLTGHGRPSVVVGSTDGWLYAVNACTGELDFSYDFGSAVGSPTFGDTDGEGN